MNIYICIKKNVCLYVCLDVIPIIDLISILMKILSFDLQNKTQVTVYIRLRKLTWKSEKRILR